MNFANIAKECAERKGINVVGIIDCASPYVIEDIENFLKSGDAYEIEDGGIIYKDKVCIILGSEVETSEVNENGKTGSAHNCCYFPTLKDIKGFSKEMSTHIKNITLSTQRSDISGYELIDIVEKYNGVLIPAHAFTPHKSYYGNCTKSLKRIFKEKYDRIPAIELGLSSDTFLADEISELEDKTYLTNSDAHSLPKIAREYNKILVEDISFKELMKAIRNEDGRKVVANYGLDPKLGKYHRTYCEKCDKSCDGESFNKLCISPKILILFLDRGINNRFMMNVDFPMVLDINEFFVEKGKKYHLRCVIEHLGESGDSGHFIANCKHFDGNWYLYSDSSIYSGGKEYQQNGIPYLIFYEN